MYDSSYTDGIFSSQWNQTRDLVEGSLPPTIFTRARKNPRETGPTPGSLPGGPTLVAVKTERRPSERLGHRVVVVVEAQAVAHVAVAVALEAAAGGGEEAGEIAAVGLHD